MTETAGHRFTCQPEPRVIAAVNVSNQFVHLLIVALGRKLEGLFEGVAAGEEAAKAEEGSSSERSSVNAFVVFGAADGQDGDAGPDVDQQERVESVPSVVVL